MCNGHLWSDTRVLRYSGGGALSLSHYLTEKQVFNVLDVKCPTNMRPSTDETQIKSRQRVADHGEVFTAEREVNAMLDLVQTETERIDSRFLEPACGTGNFLVRILERKLAVVARGYGGSRTQWEQQSLIALSSIYGIDILEDNVRECRQRLFGILEAMRTAAFPAEAPGEDYLATGRYLLERNIIWGDALTLCTPDERHEPIVFSEWAWMGTQVKRRDFTLDMLLKNQPMDEPNLFSDLGDEAFIPTPIREFPVVSYLKLPQP